MSCQLISETQCLEQLYKTIFPTISDKNGLFGHEAKWYGYMQNKSIIAFCTIGTVDNKTVFLYNVGVDPIFRHQGYGKKLMDYIIQLYGSRDIYLFVGIENHNAIKLYQKYHFIHVNKAYVPPIGEMCMKRYATKLNKK
jgi:ribosomal protein S18 acetylase RimI-like enzyme